MRTPVRVLAVVIIVPLGGFFAAPVQDVADRRTDPDRGSDTALRGEPAAWAREVTERVDDATDWTEGVAAQKVRAAVVALQEAALEEFERAHDRAADTVKQAAAETLQQASDRLQDLASGLRGR